MELLLVLAYLLGVAVLLAVMVHALSYVPNESEALALTSFISLTLVIFATTFSQLAAGLSLGMIILAVWSTGRQRHKRQQEGQQKQDTTT